MFCGNDYFSGILHGFVMASVLWVFLAIAPWAVIYNHGMNVGKLEALARVKGLDVCQEQLIGTETNTEKEASK